MLGTATGVTFSDGVWHYIEVEAFIHDSTGFINVYKDGVQILAASGADTKQQTSGHDHLLPPLRHRRHLARSPTSSPGTTST